MLELRNHNARNERNGKEIVAERLMKYNVGNKAREEVTEKVKALCLGFPLYN